MIAYNNDDVESNLSITKVPGTSRTSQPSQADVEDYLEASFLFSLSSLHVFLPGPTSSELSFA